MRNRQVASGGLKARPVDEPRLPYPLLPGALLERKFPPLDRSFDIACRIPGLSVYAFNACIGRVTAFASDAAKLSPSKESTCGREEDQTTRGPPGHHQQAGAGPGTGPGAPDLHGEMLTRIIQLLTEEKADDEPSLYKLLADLITRIDGQNRYLMELTVAVGRLGMDLPLDLVRAIDDNLDVGRRQEGHTNGGNPA